MNSTTPSSDASFNNGNFSFGDDDNENLNFYQSPLVSSKRKLLSVTKELMLKGEQLKTAQYINADIQNDYRNLSKNYQSIIDYIDVQKEENQRLQKRLRELDGFSSPQGKYDAETSVSPRNTNETLNTQELQTENNDLKLQLRSITIANDLKKNDNEKLNNENENLRSDLNIKKILIEKLQMENHLKRTITESDDDSVRLEFQKIFDEKEELKRQLSEFDEKNIFLESVNIDLREENDSLLDENNTQSEKITDLKKINEIFRDTPYYQQINRINADKNVIRDQLTKELDNVSKQNIAYYNELHYVNEGYKRYEQLFTDLTNSINDGTTTNISDIVQKYLFTNNINRGKEEIFES